MDPSSFMEQNLAKCGLSRKASTSCSFENGGNWGCFLLNGYLRKTPDVTLQFSTQSQRQKYAEADHRVKQFKVELIQVCASCDAHQVRFTARVWSVVPAARFPRVWRSAS